jgi:AraC-like DNA-binding protein
MTYSSTTGSLILDFSFRLYSPPTRFPEYASLIGGASNDFVTIGSVATAAFAPYNVAKATIGAVGQDYLTLARITAGAEFFGRLVDGQPADAAKSLVASLYGAEGGALAASGLTAIGWPLAAATVGGAFTGAALNLLKSYLCVLRDRNSIATVRHQEMVANHICDLVTLAIGANGDEKESAFARGGRAARFYCLKQDVERFLFHQDLGAEFLARKNRITERYVHMLFESEGLTLSKYILGRRLLEAYRLLADPTGGRVSDIAFSVGFNDLSYFNRAFSKRFSAKPREVRSVFQTCCART